METTVFIIAFILIGLGVLVKRFPMLIAGYNTLTKEEKEKIDTKGLSTFVCYSLVGMGIVPLVMYYIFLGIGHADWAGMSSLFPLAYIPYLIYKANTYDHNPPKKSRKYIVSISITIMVIVAILMLYGMTPSKVRFENRKLIFTGMFGVSFPANDITSMKLTDKIPEISLRLNGLSVGGINKGRFKMVQGGSCFIYVTTSKSPYIVFTEKNGKEIYYNAKDSIATVEIYQDLKPLFK